ncbi:hypothetical protein, partial [uncultured Sphingomonas sp.]|uniref:hypothetical protein n=1 Tax=uncultured Sphingomonas sp. TaxID=158754 RepID=UPI0025E67372
MKLPPIDFIVFLLPKNETVVKYNIRYRNCSVIGPTDPAPATDRRTLRCTISRACAAVMRAPLRALREMLKPMMQANRRELVAALA